MATRSDKGLCCQVKIVRIFVSLCAGERVDITDNTDDGCSECKLRMLLHVVDSGGGTEWVRRPHMASAHRTSTGFDQYRFIKITFRCSLNTQMDSSMSVAD